MVTSRSSRSSQGGLSRKEPGEAALPCQALKAKPPALPAYRDFGLPRPALSVEQPENPRNAAPRELQASTRHVSAPRAGAAHGLGQTDSFPAIHRQPKVTGLPDLNPGGSPSIRASTWKSRRRMSGCSSGARPNPQPRARALFKPAPDTTLPSGVRQVFRPGSCHSPARPGLQVPKAPQGS